MSHLLPLHCLPAKNNVMLYHAINVSQSDLMEIHVVGWKCKNDKVQCTFKARGIHVASQNVSKLC